MRAAAAAAASAPAAPFASLTHDDVLLSLGLIAQTLSRRLLTTDDDAAAARDLSDAWAARPPRPDDDEGCLARVRRSAELAAEHAERVAAEAPRLLRTFGARVSGLCRDTWTCVPPGLSAADADRVRAQHPIWRAIIDLKHGEEEVTRLGYAVYNGKLARVRELCDWRADIDLADKQRLTPLYLACDQNHISIVRELLDRGADVEDNATDDGHSCLHTASFHGFLDIVRELIARGADIDAADNYGNTPLLHASAEGHIDVIRALLAAGANKRDMNFSGHTAYFYAGDNIAHTRDAIHALLDAAP